DYVVVCLNVEPGRNGNVRQHEIEFVHAEFRKEPNRLLLSAIQRDLLVEVERGLKQLERDQFRHHIHDSNPEGPRLSSWPTADRFDEFLAGLEDVLRVAPDQLARIGELQLPSTQSEQRGSNKGLQALELRADRRAANAEFATSR